MKSLKIQNGVRLFRSIFSRYAKEQDVKCIYASDNNSTGMKMSEEQWWKYIDRGGELGGEMLGGIHTGIYIFSSYLTENKMSQL